MTLNVFTNGVNMTLNVFNNGVNMTLNVFTNGVNMTQFICCCPAFSTNYLKLLSVAWSQCSRWLAALLLISQQCLSLSFVTMTNSLSNCADIPCCITIHIFQPFMNVIVCFIFCILELNLRTLSNMYLDVSPFEKLYR